MQMKSLCLMPFGQSPSSRGRRISRNERAMCCVRSPLCKLEMQPSVPAGGQMGCRMLQRLPDETKRKRFVEENCTKSA